MSEISETYIIIGVGIVFVAIAISAYYYFTKKSSKEHYGGPVKNLRKVPMTDCFSMCDRWTNHCLVTPPYGNSDNKCQRSGLACKLSCYYSLVQRF